MQAQKLIQPHDRIMVGVSGGPDSTALLHLLHRSAHVWPVNLGVAHFDHGLRGEDSQADAAWVADLAASLNLPCHLGTGDVRAHRREAKTSLQAAARHLRLGFLHQIRRDHDYHKLALGHTADDQMELFFLRLSRGAGPEGLKGMWPHSPEGIIRPLLRTAKSHILAWLEAECLSYRLDKSNLSRRYRRNRLRLDVLPHLLAFNPRLADAVWRFQTLLQEQEDFLRQETWKTLSALALTAPNGPLRLPVAGLLALPAALQQRVLRTACVQAGVPLERLTWRQVEEALHLCHRPHPSGEVSLPGSWRLVREGAFIFWQNHPSPLPSRSEYLLPPEPTGTMSALNWTFTWKTAPATGHPDFFQPDPHLALMDHSRLHFPLRLRTFRAGDRFQPLGMSGVKKLQDFFVDAKIPKNQRPFVPLLLSRDQIVWVVGHRLADPVKLTPGTRLILRLEASPTPTP